MTEDKKEKLDDATVSKMGKMAVKHCEPLYFNNLLKFNDGHSKETANGTVTYVKYQEQFYAITCAHIYFSQYHDGALIKSLYVANSEMFRPVTFLTFDKDDIHSKFRPLRKDNDDTSNPDIAIAPIKFEEIKTHFDDKDKAFIDLDNWRDGSWEFDQLVMATGFPTEHKEHQGNKVAANMAQVYINTTRHYDPYDERFLLKSELDEDNSIYFSGMSGGPVFQFDDKGNNLRLVGIIYEGTPGSSEHWDNRPEESVYEDNCITIRAYSFTPERFDMWLRQLNFID